MMHNLVEPGSRMGPLFRLWSVTALCVALLLIVRGAFAAALVCFLFSPAPVLLFSRGSSDERRLSLSWLGALVIIVLVLCALFVLIVHLGGIPQVHQWSSLIREGK
jgi:hypothetical protein